jgi:periplasmic divalent cation tolerance protein
MKLSLTYVPCKDEAEARRIGNELIDRKLAACINMFPIKSIYDWKGKRVDDVETVMIAKSLKRKDKDIASAVRKSHSYEVPAILQFDVEANPEYAKWVEGCL